MHLTFKRTGGFANIPVTAELDTEKMSVENANKLIDLLNKAKPFDAAKVGENMPDAQNYELQVDDQVFRTNDAHLTDALQELFDFILEVC